MILTAENYYSQEANREYMSVSQYKAFCGTYGRQACEERAVAELDGEWEQEKTPSLLVGSFVDSYFEGSLDKFKMENPELFTKASMKKTPSNPKEWELLQTYKKAEEIIERIERDPLFMKYMSGEKQVIMTGEIGGAKWKIKIDSLVRDICITDLKVMKSLRDVFRSHDAVNMGFVEYWGYDVQGAVYQEIVRQNTGKVLPFYIAAASKEKETDIEVIHIDNDHLRNCLSEVESNVAKIQALKDGVFQPIRCESCDYCKHTKILTAPISYVDLIPGA